MAGRGQSRPGTRQPARWNIFLFAGCWRSGYCADVRLRSTKDRMMRVLAKIFFALVLSFTTIVVNGQQQATYAQYMFNGLAINPAYAGASRALDISVLSRFQNVGLSGAPNTQSLSVHSPLVNQRMAIGLLAVHDQIGVIEQTGVNGIYAYRLPFPNKTSLAFGAQVGFTSYQADYSQLELYNPDLAFTNDVRQSRPNLGAGIFYSGDLFYVGVSMPHLVNN